MSAYYDENDPYAAQWLRNLIAAGHIAAGDVDERSIVDVRGDELKSYNQCHFFAGIGGWSDALRLAGWPDDRPVWTGSCPCQPFSAAGKGNAADDERHLWPAWFSLIRECRPATIFGEQVEAAIGWGWLDAVFADLEAEGYACGAAVLPACGVGAPHIRQRLWFVANAERRDRRRQCGDARGAAIASDRQAWPTNGHPVGGSSSMGELANSDGRDTSTEGIQRSREHGQREEDGRVSWDMDDSPCDGRRESVVDEYSTAGSWQGRRYSPWSGATWLSCTDGKARPVESGTFPLAHGIPGRLGRLRAYGNAIVPQVAAEFIRACT